eukprot:TRINITY_DN37807_c0_g1_i1.p1 TRINITY_DN37807_c0_g1~~TRINITY_DN37807_c0_g1_i1.p1  ORF type:complete len:567 (+),score=94.03 TRINITY_DN37807_c0_g1_i1:189-1889(+)
MPPGQSPDASPDPDEVGPPGSSGTPRQRDRLSWAQSRVGQGTNPIPLWRTFTPGQASASAVGTPSGRQVSSGSQGFGLSLQDMTRPLGFPGEDPAEEGGGIVTPRLSRQATVSRQPTTTMQPEPVAVDRHELFIFTVQSAGEKFQVRPPPRHAVPPLGGGGSSMLASTSGPGPWSAREHTISGWDSQTIGGQTWSPRSNSTRGELVNASWAFSQSCSSSPRVKSYGVAVRPELLPRQDCIPDRLSGRRSHTAEDRTIRIFILLPGKQGRVAAWVPPDLRVGPLVHSEQRSRFTDVWGADAEARGYLAGKSTKRSGDAAGPEAEMRWFESEEGQRPLTPVRRLLSQQARSREGAVGTMEAMEDSRTLDQLLSVQSTTDLSKAPGGNWTADVFRTLGSLKGLLEAATGIPASRQKLVVGKTGALTDDSKALCQYGVGHGALLILSERVLRGKPKEVKHLAGPGLKKSMVKQNDIMMNLAKFLSVKVGNVSGKDLIEVMPAWHKPGVKQLEDIVERPEGVEFHDYGDMHDNKIFDAAGVVRRRFGLLPRIAGASAAAKQLQVYADAARV